MFYDNELNFVKKMLNKCHLKTFIINPSDVLSDELSNGLERVLSSTQKTFYDVFPDIKPNTIYRVKSLFLCSYIFLQLPFSENNDVLIIGPYLVSDISKQEVLEQGEKLKLSPKHTKNLELFYTALPVIREENHIFAIINSFAEFIWSGSENFESLEVSIDNVNLFLPKKLEETLYDDEKEISFQNMERRYSYENELMSAVAQGNLHKAEFMLTSFSSLSFENRVPDRLRNMKNYCIIMNTLLRKAAENGGVHPIYLDSVSSDFARRIEDLSSVPLVAEFMQEILKTYCRLVKRHSIKNYSPLVQKAIIQIEHDLTGDLSLSAMAKMNNVSSGYFSSLFKKETGQTLTEYVNNKRMKLAKHLLKTTNLQIQTIAGHCGILDFHYFCRVFKESVGKTPTEYRNNISFD